MSIWELTTLTTSHVVAMRKCWTEWTNWTIAGERAQIVKQIMAEKGLKMIEASKYVKAHGLYTKKGV